MVKEKSGFFSSGTKTYKIAFGTGLRTSTLFINMYLNNFPRNNMRNCRWPCLAGSRQHEIHEGRAKSACKPGSVRGLRPVAAIPLGPRLPADSSNLPGSGADHAMASLFGLAPDGVCQPRTLPPGQWALTRGEPAPAPAALSGRALFHPCLIPHGPSAVCFLVH